MSDLNVNRPFKEAVCVDVMRVFDSCSSQECLEDLEFAFECTDQEVIDRSDYIKAKCIDVVSVAFAVDPVPFNKGFYTVDVTYNFKAEIEAHSSERKAPAIVFGKSSFSKKVILFGSDGNTQRFVSDGKPSCRYISQTSGCTCCCDNATLPTAAVNVAPPMCLDAKLVSLPCDGKAVLITIGIFAIIQLERPVPIMIPSFDYCMPSKECSSNTDSPCELFDKIAFPTSEFFPKGLEEDHGCKCLDEEPNEAEQTDETS